MRLIYKLSMLFQRNRFRNELEEEMAFHREETARELRDSGMPADQARSRAAQRFGNATKQRERSHEVIAFRIESVLQDSRFALRQMRKNPGFALMAVLILALGMGVSVAMFGFVDAALMRPLPYSEPNRLVSVDESALAFPRSPLSYADYEDWKRLNTTLDSLDVYTSYGFLLRGSTATQPVPAARVSAGFFRTLGVRPMLGRDFLPGEDEPGKPKIIMLTWGAWTKYFGQNPNVVGQSINLSEESYTVIGVLPREFAFAPRGSAEFWVPILDRSGCEKRRSCHNLNGVGRLREGVSIAAARADFKNIAAQLERLYPDSNKDQGASVGLLSEIIVGDVRPILLMLLGGAGLLLVIACVNVASLLLVRSESRKREMAVRGALGASRQRLLRQFVTEGLILSVLGCCGGLAMAVGMMSALIRIVPKPMTDAMPFLGLVGLNAHTSLYSASIATLAALLLAITPMGRLSLLHIFDGLSEGGRASAGRFWRRLGSNLVVVELGIALVLLVGAGLLGRSFYRLLHVETGFDTSHLATLQVMEPDTIYKKDEQSIGLYRELQRRISALPGVEAVGLTSVLPVQCNCNTDWVRFVGKPFHGEHNEVNERDVSPGYLQALGGRLVRGRWFIEQDQKPNPQAIVVNETFARRYYPGEDPIGKKVGNTELAPDSIRQIVGVIADVREGALDQDVWPTEYQSIYQGPDNFFYLAIRTRNDGATILPEVAATVRSIDPSLGVSEEQTMRLLIDTTQSALLHRFSSWLVGGFALMALILGVVGLYGVIAYSVSQRTREIGVRMALGAQRSSVYKMVLREAGKLISAGLAIGLGGAVAAGTLIRKLLFGVQAWDLPTLAAVAVVLGISALLATYFPARRAASINPTDALRAE